MCPPRRSPTRSERSRLTFMPGRSSPRLVSLSVSGPAWNEQDRSSAATTVRQTPLIATLAPSGASLAMVGSSMRRSVPAPSVETSRTVPRDSTRPVNILILCPISDASQKRFCPNASAKRRLSKALVDRRHIRPRLAAQVFQDERTQREDERVPPEHQQGRQGMKHNEKEPRKQHLDEVADVPSASKDLAGGMRIRDV